MKLPTLIGILLAGACAVLALVAGALFVGVGSSIDSAGSVDALDRPDGSNFSASSGFQLGEQDSYAVIADRPLFNDDRQPRLDESETSVIGPPIIEKTDLDVAVTGIIITPDVRLAILTDNKSRETMRVREGMPLEGEMGAWTLSSIEPRKLKFDSNGEEAEVELVVSTAAPTPPATSMMNPGRGEDTAQDGETPRIETVDAGNRDGSAESADARAEEIRQRVAERRAQLRAEAERRRQQMNDDN